MKKYLLAVYLLCVGMVGVTGCAGENGSNPTGQTVVSENIVSEDAISENAVSEDAISDDVVILPESGNGEIETEETTADAQTPVAMAPPAYLVPWKEAGLKDHVMSASEPTCLHDWRTANVDHVLLLHMI